VLRQILVVALGILIGFLVAGAGGYFLYRFSDVLPHGATLGRLARYVVNPVIALTVGTCVGALAKSRPGLLAALSLTPLALVPLFSRRLNALHETILFFSSFLSVCLGVAAAIFIFRVRTRTKSAT
jgi:hypothetical protein